MDVKSIIREMLKKGMSEEQIKESLVDLGIENADHLVQEATEQFKEVSLSESVPRSYEESEKSTMEEKPPVGLFGSLAEEKEEAPKPMTRPSSLLDSKNEIKPLAITSITDEGEKEVTVGGLDAPATGEKIVTPLSSTSLGDLDSVESKLDETIALLKALQDINKKILDTERSVLLRLKT